MFPIDQKYFHEKSQEITKQQDQIQQSYFQGLFAPFKEQLSQADLWHQTSWYGRIENIATGHPSSEYDRLMSYLFAIVLDEKLNDNEKQSEIKSSLASLTQEELENFYHKLSQLPPVITIYILRFSDKDFWSKAISKITFYRENLDVEIIFTEWMREVCRSNWEIQHKMEFLDDLQKLCSDWSEVLYAFLLNHNQNTQETLLNVCSETLFKDIHNHIATITIQISKQNNEKSSWDIPLKGYKRMYFLNIFICEFLDHPDACRFALNFEQRDWNWIKSHLKSKEKEFFTKLVMKWMTEVAILIETKKLNLSNFLESATIRQFFGEASSAIQRLGDWNYLSEQEKITFSLSMTPLLLTHCFDLFTEDCKQSLLLYFLTYDQEHFKSWIHVILQQNADRPIESSLQKVAQLFEVISKADRLSTAFKCIFSYEHKDFILMLSTYAALKKQFRKMVLVEILAEKNRGINLLKKCLETALVDKQVKPCIYFELTKDLFDLLSEIDPKVPLNLSHTLNQSALVQSSSNLKESIAIVFPVEEDMNDPKVRQKIAIQKLKMHFLTHGISYRERKDFSNSLLKDIRAQEKVREWVPRLFEALPREVWPLIFINFEVEISDRFYYENPNCSEIRPPKWLPDLTTWKEIATETLVQICSNPSLEEEKDYAMQEVYRIITQTNTFKEVLRHLIETKPIPCFIPILNHMATCCFYYQFDTFKSLVAEALNGASVSKIYYLASCLSQQERKALYQFKIQSSFWNEPFIKHDERGKLSIELAEKLQERFLDLIIDRPEFALIIIKFLCQNDPNCHLVYFSKWIQFLIDADKEEQEKTLIFYQLVITFSNVGIDFSELRNANIFSTASKQIQQWYEQSFSINLKIL
ncbi:MAG: hypothetical protein Tsb0021_08980 [Chlamydiales bacterium]